ncbi:MAG: GDP-mannose 4,6-dehydratase [Terriglobales bacterium]
MAKTALITGISGQDGSYLAELLLEKGYEVHGIARRMAIENPEHRLFRIRHLVGKIELHGASLESYPSLYQVISRIRPDEVYHLAAQSFVSYSFEDEFTTMAANVNGTHYMLAAVRELVPKSRFYFAGSSEMFGNPPDVPQNEETIFRPRSPYGISKVTGYYLTRNYREAYGMYACSGILYNHESPRRGLEFVTRKITSTAAKIKLGLAHELRLGNLEARRDWGHAREYVKAMWLMLQQSKPDDYVIATGENHSVGEFAELAFSMAGLNARDYVKIDDKYKRPAEVDNLLGNCEKAKKVLGWQYSMKFNDLVREMVESDIAMFAYELETKAAVESGAGA